MNHFPPPHSFSDPNARLLASVMPGPPPPLGVRALQSLQGTLGRESARLRRWLRRGSDSLPFLLTGLGSVGLGIGMYLGSLSRALSHEGLAHVANATETRREVAPPEAPQPSTVAASLTPIPCATGATAPPTSIDDASTPRAVSPRRPARTDGARTQGVRKAAKRQRALEKNAAKRSTRKRDARRLARGSTPRRASKVAESR